MLKNNKYKAILSSVIILLPVLFGIIMWNELPAVMTTHWGADGNADGFSGKAFAVFGLPAILLGLHLLCLLGASLDKAQRGQSPKALGMIFWIIPAISLFANGIMYRAAFGREVDFALFTPVLLGITFILTGNYLPKVKQNKTLGIKVPWTLRNEENWNKTHRFGGKVWVAAGIVALFAAFLPLKAMLWVTVCVIAAAVILPVVYSYGIYKRHQREGAVYAAAAQSKAERVGVRVAAVILPLLLAGIGILMFTGDIEVRCEDASFKIEADYWADLEAEYAEIDTIEYRGGLDVGIRTAGFGSARLSMGSFQNEEFGPYTLYAYTGAEEFIVLSADGKKLVIGMRNAEDTQTIYAEILAKTGR